MLFIPLLPWKKKNINSWDSLSFQVWGWQSYTPGSFPERSRWQPRDFQLGNVPPAVRRKIWCQGSPLPYKPVDPCLGRPQLQGEHGGFPPKNVRDFHPKAGHFLRKFEGEVVKGWNKFTSRWSKKLEWHHMKSGQLYVVNGVSHRYFHKECLQIGTIPISKNFPHTSLTPNCFQKYFGEHPGKSTWNLNKKYPFGKGEPSTQTTDFWLQILFNFPRWNRLNKQKFETLDGMSSTTHPMRHSRSPSTSGCDAEKRRAFHGGEHHGTLPSPTTTKHNGSDYLLLIL